MADDALDDYPEAIPLHRVAPAWRNFAVWAGLTALGLLLLVVLLGVRLVQDSPLYSRIVESEPELFGLFSRSDVFPIRQFADGIAHTLRRCGADHPEADLANIADILLRVALGIIVFPTDRLDITDQAAVRDYAARYLRDLKEQEGSWTLAAARYHAGPDNDPAQKQYVCEVIANMVASGFGTWTDSARTFCR